MTGLQAGSYLSERYAEQGLSGFNKHIYEISAARRQHDDQLEMQKLRFYTGGGCTA